MSVYQLAEKILNHLAQHYHEHGVSKFNTKSLANYFETDDETAEQALTQLHESGHVRLDLDGSVHVTDQGINQGFQE